MYYVIGKPLELNGLQGPYKRTLSGWPVCLPASSLLTCREVHGEAGEAVASARGRLVWRGGRNAFSLHTNYFPHLIATHLHQANATYLQ